MADLAWFVDPSGGFELVGDADGAWFRTDTTVNVSDCE